MAASRACPQDAETTLSATDVVFDLQPCDNYRTMAASSAHSAAAMQHPTAAELAMLKLLWSRLPLTAPELHDGLALVLGWGGAIPPLGKRWQEWCRKGSWVSPAWVIKIVTVPRLIKSRPWPGLRSSH